jgi:periplasmic protein TonB
MFKISLFFITLGLMICAIQSIKAQNMNDSTNQKKDEMMIVEEQPVPQGGIEGFYKYISKNLKYPKQARRDRVEGKVIVQFVVDTDGSITNIKIKKGIGAGCDEEAIRVMQNCPKWQPARYKGKPIRVTLSTPISFFLG